MAVRDVVFITVIIFAIGIVFLIFNNVMSTTTTSLINTPAINATDSAVDAFEAVQNQINRLDYVVLALFIGLSLALIITGWFVGSHPVFMIIYFIVVTIAVILAAVLSNSWETVSTGATFVNNIGYFPITNHLLNSLPFYIAGVAFMGMIALFARPRE